jgi:hypothetical protein
MPSRRSTCLLAALPCIAVPNHGIAAMGDPAPQRVGQVAIQRIDYRGWPDSILLGNGLVEAVIVPAVGRVMQFRLAGTSEGPFWENPGFAGQRLAPDPNGWVNYGGDKAWPAPQGAWAHFAGHLWPPPGGFDGLPTTPVIDGFSVTLVSPVDPGFGICVRRRVELDPNRPVMTITTSFEKKSGPPSEIGVWVITQLNDPVEIHVLVPNPSGPRVGYNRLSEELPPNLREVDGRLIITRDPHAKHKIGARSGTLVWVGRNEVLRIDSAPVPGGKYPDGGSSAEVYTNSDPLPYVELEMLGPLVTLEPGHTIERVSTYSLSPATGGHSEP